jgi:hypothetical protein
MLTDDMLMGIKPTDRDQIRQVKLRLPIDQVMKLHRLRILKSQPISKFVAEALDTYFEEERGRQVAAVLTATTE